MREIPQGAPGGPPPAGVGAATPSARRESHEGGGGAADEAYRRHVIESASYGAVFFNWIYLLAMRAWAHAVLAFVFSVIVSPTIWIVWIVYGMYGKRIAWQTRRWRDFDDFLACQRAWTRAAIVWTIVIAAIMLLGVVLRIVFPHHQFQFRPSI